MSYFPDPARASSLAGKADLAAMSEALAGKANASTVGGLSTALNAKANSSDVNSALATKASASDIPQPASVVPSSEAIGGAMGTSDKKFAMEDHKHPRMSSTTYATLGSNGQAAVTFSRTFINKPGLNLTETDATANAAPLILRGLGWAQDGQGRYTGVTIQGMRSQPLPNLTAVSGLLTAVITGVNAIVSALSGYNVFGGSAAGATVSVIAVGRSDVAST